ncbi:2-C-methyl-D-erythritol 4-phosphate cytidylyltransferase [Oceanithermus desulfurans]
MPPPATVSVLVPAAGQGTRLGRGPKAFVRVGGRTLLEWVLAAFAWADEVRVALPPGVSPPPAAANVRFVPGGAERQESVARLLEGAGGDVVLVHDAARPFVVPAVVDRLLVAVAGSGAAVPVVPLPDTLIEPEEGRYGPALDRSRYALVQTPQAFFREVLAEAHQLARAEGRTATDEAQLVQALGYPVELVPGDRRMFKVTFPEDLALAEALARVWEERPE